MLNDLQFRILRHFYPGDPGAAGAAEHERNYSGRVKIEKLLGPELLSRLRGKIVIDFGCGGGAEAIEYARQGARQVIGLDIRDDVLAVARERAAAAGLSDICSFTTTTDTPADVVVSLDAFEHFDDTADILRIMYSLLKPGGQAIFSFGPPWLHPLGGHLFSVFPWAHLLFSETALCRWRSIFKTDGATRFHEGAGGLNRMTIGRFQRLAAASPFELVRIEPVPIRGFASIHNRLTREFLSSVVRGYLEKRPSNAANPGA